jgi:replication factor C subunit 1
MWKNQQLRTASIGSIAKDESVMINNFDAAHRLLNHGQVSLDIKYPQFRNKMDLFFIDYDLIPLLVQENYLTSMGDRSSLRDLNSLADAAEFISFGDCLARQVRTNQDWSLLPNMGLASSIAPCLIVKGATFYPRFPEWLGKNSS